jgi:hypothetical protein
MASLEPDVVDALNAVLEDERACVEIAVALANGATAMQEQSNFTEMGTAEVVSCCALRERLADADAPVTQRINGAVWRVLGAETYDERLLAFAMHQAAIRDGASELLSWITDPEASRVVQELVDAHAHWVGWLEQRAQRFAASRDFEMPARATGRQSSPADAQPDGWEERENDSQAVGSEQASGDAPERRQESGTNGSRRSREPASETTDDVG